MMNDLWRAYRFDELMVSCDIYDQNARMESLRLTKQVFDEFASGPED
jgi:hypothetical protein